MRALNLSVFVFCFSVTGLGQTIPDAAAIDAAVNKIMTNTHAKGMAVAVIDHGKSDMFMPMESATTREIR